MLWVITSYFNPVGYSSRAINFRKFRDRINQPLLVVEVARNAASLQLRPDDAERVVQILGEDMIWQKERLLNVALNHLPPTCQFVAWVDCDIEFKDENWARKACSVLEEYPIVQLFDRFRLLEPANGQPGQHAQHEGRSFAHLLTRGVAPETLLNTRTSDRGGHMQEGHIGLAWAARWELLERHGLYDACILGGGDKAIVSAALGYFDSPLVIRSNALMMTHYTRWARPFCEDINGRVGCVSGMIEHLWHGQLIDRRYYSRYAGFKGFDFDPMVHIEYDECGAWRWANAPVDMQNYVRDYFLSRREDSI